MGPEDEQELGGMGEGESRADDRYRPENGGEDIVGYALRVTAPCARKWNSFVRRGNRKYVKSVSGEQS
ncbi:hypothetical protein RRG08_008036 [Elysia crispata]|uniref:Uncharacterized protein n=1 Tax=Elysia crispata TaxID=231223 RepID=A0AAE1AJH2_9GAST|nr:hypothetical protein RRG08_008036 [Elysia crispata]